jgi:hypothetical protein
MRYGGWIRNDCEREEETIVANDVARRTHERWQVFLTELSRGKPLLEAMEAAKVCRGDIAFMARDDAPAEQQRLLAALSVSERRAYSLLDYHETCKRISAGMKERDAVIAVRGVDELTEFSQMTELPGLKPHYEAAKKISVRRHVDQVIEIIDDKSADVLESTKLDNRGNPVTSLVPNNAAVARAKLQAEMRVRIGQAYEGERWNPPKEKAQVTVEINAVALLEARSRLDRHRAGKAPGLISQDERESAVDAVIEPAQPAADVEAQDEQPQTPPASYGID